MLINRIKGFWKELGITFWLQVAVLAAAAASVESAGWVKVPSLILVAFLAALTAALLASLREHKQVHHLWAVLAGGLLAYLGGIYLAEADQWYLRFGALHSRLVQWWSAVVGEDATTDTLPLSVTIMAITWLAAYFTSWSLFRHRNVWATLLPIGAGLVINLTYLPERFSVYLFVFLFFGLLMLVHVTSLQRRALLQAQDTPHPASMQRLSLAHGLWLSVAILGITIVLPFGDSPTPLKWVFRPMDRAVDDLQDEVYRIFAAVPGHNLASMRFFGSVLPLLRPVPMGEDPVMFVDTWYPLYWPAIAYDQYTSKAWKVEDTESIPVASVIYADDEEGGALLPYGVESISYQVHMHVASPYLLVAGEPFAVSPDARQVIPAAKAFQLDLATPGQNGDLPMDLQRLASTLATAGGNDDNPALTDMPFDLRVSQVIKEVPSSGRKTTIEVEIDSLFYYSDLQQAVGSEGATVGIEVVQPSPKDSAVSFKPVKRLRPDGEYRVTAGLSTASEEALRDSSQQYPPEILDRYLQLPDSLPSRVSVLASNVVADASNPYDKAVAIETYLRNLEYSTASNPIPYDADTVDYFLFESEEGYSDYFSSAMATMLRTLGIPTRLVLGFGPGKEDRIKHGFLVRDKDSHSWPEVYFPGTGWVPFEPTPIYETRARGLPGSPFGIEDFLAEGAEQDQADGTGGLLEPRDDQQERHDLGGPLSGGQGPKALPERYFGTPLGRGGVLFALFLLTGFALMRILWMRQYGDRRSTQGAYERMHRLAAFLGLPSPPSQTAYEFSDSLSRLIPEARADVDLVSNTFVRQRYGGITPSAVEELRLMWAWRRIRRALMARLRQTREPATSLPKG
ncbi:MAG: transglutaminase domain-containing protein [Chloroflexi bacterium]|nr:transglutaminase domain-containing protein [Chloroflexota bacterium]